MVHQLVIVASSPTQSIHRFLGRAPFLNVPGSLRSIIRIVIHIHFSLHCLDVLCHLIRLFRIFPLSSTISTSFPTSAFLILPRLVTPVMARKHLISTTSNFFIRSFFTAQVYIYYLIYYLVSSISSSPSIVYFSTYTPPGVPCNSLPVSRYPFKKIYRFQNNKNNLNSTVYSILNQ